MGHANTILSRLWQNVEKNSDKFVYTFISNNVLEKLSYFELDHTAAIIATILCEQGAKEGDRVLIMLPQSLTYMKAFFGCLYAQLIAVPLYIPYNSNHLKKVDHTALDSGANFIITDSSTIALMKENDWLNNHNHLTIIDINQIHMISPASYKRKYPNDNSLAFLQYTSGSTGQPKGVMVSHANLLANLAMLQEATAMNEQTVLVNWAPLFHDLGLIGNALQAVFLNASIYLMSPAEFIKRPLTWLEVISAYHGTHSYGPNFAFDLCLKTISDGDKSRLDLSSWTFALNGSEPIRLQTMIRFNEAFQECGLSPLTSICGYGLAEATFYVSCSKFHQGLKYEKIDTEQLQKGLAVISETSKTKPYLNCGKPVQPGKLLIVNPETLQTLPPRAVGEIWVQGPHVCQGYWGNDELSTSIFNIYTADTNEGPYLRTGDLGYLNELGELFVVSRLKDTIIIRGKNYAPHDIEQAVENCSELIRTNRVAAFSIDDNDEEKLVIAIEFAEELSIDVREQLTQKIKQQVAMENNIIVHDVVYLKKNELPRTTSGKLQRQLTKKNYLTTVFATA